MKNFTIPFPKTILFVLLVVVTTITTQAQTFDYKDSGTDFILYDLSIPEGQSNIAYAAGSKYTFDTEGIIIKTTDGGETWNTIYPTNGTSPSFEKIEFIDENKGFVAGYDLFMKTVDGGASWTPMTVGTDVYLYNNLSFFDENIGFVSAQLNNAPYFAIYLTTDGGNTWTPATDITDAGGIAVGYGDQNILYSVGADERIAKSTDGGDTWTQIYSGTLQNYLISLYFKDADNGLVAGDDGLIKTTHDGGTSWTDFSTGYHHFYGLAYKGDQLMAAGSDEDIYFSEDNGDTWSLLFDGQGQTVFYEIGFFADGTGLICGSGGTMVKFDGVFLGTNDNQLPENNVVGFYSKNNGTFNLQSETESIDHVAIYNMMGQRVGSFENTANSMSIDVSAYSTGIYLAVVTSQKKNTIIKFLKQ